MNLALLASMHPRDLRDGSPADLASLLDDDRSAALLEMAPARRALAGRILHPPMDASDLTGLISARPTTSSHPTRSLSWLWRRS